MIRRRNFITLLGGAAAWPLAARAQQADRVRRIGVLMNLAADDSESQARLTVFRQALQELGWTVGRNVLMEYRWGAADVARARKLAAELIALANMRDAGEIERAFTDIADRGIGGVIVTGSSPGGIHRDLIIGLVARYRLPTIYPLRYFVTAGGMISYGPDTIDLFRRAAAYVNRILRGENPAELPVQNPTKYELVINLKTAEALGIEIPTTMRALANEVIE
jgi:hypothetical protein